MCSVLWVLSAVVLVYLMLLTAFVGSVFFVPVRGCPRHVGVAESDSLCMLVCHRVVCSKASADRGCHMVSVTDPYSRIRGFLD
jgi:hypothetical protein